MAVVNFAHREIIASIVYFGPPGSGTTSNLLYLYDHLDVEEKSPNHHFAAHNETHESRFFDYMPVSGGEVSGFTMRVRVYSLPGDIRNPTHREEILQDVDALVFVADSRKGREADNTRYLLELESGLQERNIEMSSLPMVFQLNHRDAAKVVDERAMVRELNPFGCPVVLANGITGKGVLETHEAVMVPLLERIEQSLSGDQRAIRLNTVHHGSREKSEDVIRRHINAIRHSEAADQDKESVEEATRARLRRRHAHLKPAAELNLHWHHKTLGEATPVIILESAIENHQVRVDVLMREDGDSPAKRLTLHLSGRATPGPASSSAVTASLSIPETHPERPSDLPPVIYGVMGVVGGLLIGTFVAFLMYG
jgi:hypothetical protein